MAHYGGLWGILSGLAKSTDHPSTPKLRAGLGLWSTMYIRPPATNPARIQTGLAEPWERLARSSVIRSRKPSRLGVPIPG